MCGACRKHGGKRQLERLIRVSGINVKIDYLYVVKVCVGSVGIGQSPVSLFFCWPDIYSHVSDCSKYLEWSESEHFFRQRSITKPNLVMKEPDTEQVLSPVNVSTWILELPSSNFCQTSSHSDGRLERFTPVHPSKFRDRFASRVFM
jgi:hypothetical protein